MNTKFLKLSSRSQEGILWLVEQAYYYESQQRYGTVGLTLHFVEGQVLEVAETNNCKYQLVSKGGKK